jgi:hypothetical protein
MRAAQAGTRSGYDRDPIVQTNFTRHDDLPSPAAMRPQAIL